MKIIKSYPPNYAKIKEVFPDLDMYTVFTYGDTLYTPNISFQLPKDLLAHEEVHMRQQTNPGLWWDQYLRDPKFRLEQEVEAYKRQWIIYQATMPRDRCFMFLHRICGDLSSSMYGNMITFEEALDLIKPLKKGGGK